MDPTIYAWQVVDCSDYEYTRVLGTYATEDEATSERARIASIMKFRGVTDEDLVVNGFLLPLFGCEVEPLHPGEMWDSTMDSAFRSLERMLDMHYVGKSWYADPDPVIEDSRYYADKRSRSLPRLAKILEYVRIRLTASCARRDIANSIYEREDIRAERYAAEERAWRAKMDAEIKAEKPRRTIKDMLDDLSKLSKKAE